jgi:hypothetical protein
VLPPGTLWSGPRVQQACNSAWRLSCKPSPTYGHGVVASTSLVDVVGAVAALASVVGVVAGGLWTYFRFLRDAPYMARANLTIEADLLVHEEVDLLRVKCTLSSIGRGRVLFDTSDDYPPNVAVYSLTPQLAEHPPKEWTEVSGTVEVFPVDKFVEGGEVLEDVALIWIGRRAAGTIAYRVVASFNASEKVGAEPFTWQAVTIVPVEAQVFDPSSSAAPSLGAS